MYDSKHEEVSIDRKLQSSFTVLLDVAPILMRLICCALVNHFKLLALLDLIRRESLKGLIIEKKGFP